MNGKFRAAHLPFAFQHVLGAPSIASSCKGHLDRPDWQDFKALQHSTLCCDVGLSRRFCRRIPFAWTPFAILSLHRERTGRHVAMHVVVLLTVFAMVVDMAAAGDLQLVQLRAGVDQEQAARLEAAKACGGAGCGHADMQMPGASSGTAAPEPHAYLLPFENWVGRDQKENGTANISNRTNLPNTLFALPMARWVRFGGKQNVTSSPSRNDLTDSPMDGSVATANPDESPMGNTTNFTTTIPADLMDDRVDDGGGKERANASVMQLEGCQGGADDCQSDVKSVADTAAARQETN